MALLAGPQLVVPLSNARFALNAANSRWGSLYDALYGTDALAQDGDLAAGKGYNEKRGAAVIAFARDFLDERRAAAGRLAQGRQGLCHQRRRSDGAACGWHCRPGWPSQSSSPDIPARRQTRLRCYWCITGCISKSCSIAASAIGKTDAAGISDVVLESALSTIMDLEDSIAAVDAEDKVATYRNWLGLMQGNLAASFRKRRQDACSGC